MRGLLVAGGMGLLLVAAAAPEVRFTDVTAAVGVDFTHDNSATASKYLQETMGGGVALLDFDNDGRLDIFLTNGARLEDPTAGGMPDKSDRRFWNRLYRQQPDGTFVDVSEKAGVTGLPQNHYGMGVAAGDYDNDGFADLYVTNYAVNTLYRSNGDGTFSDVTERAGVGAGGASAGFFDYDNDGRLDLLVTRYLRWQFTDNRYCGENKPGYRAYCHPDNFDPIGNVLYRNNGDGTFTDVSAASGIGAHEGKGLGVAFADYDRDGFIDVYVANDSVQCFLFRNKGDGTFAELGLLAGVGFNEDGKTFAGIGADFADYDNDGHSRHLRDRPVERAVPAVPAQRGWQLPGRHQHLRRLGCHAAVLWLEHALRGLRQRRVEGHLCGAGSRHGTIEKTAPNLRYLQPPLLLRNERTRFERVVPGDVFRVEGAGRGAAFGDLDNDGDIDVVIANLGQRPSVLRNEGGERSPWIRVTTTGTRSKPRWHRGSREGRLARADAVLHRDYGRRVSLCERPAAAGGAGLRGRRVARPDPVAIRRPADVRARQCADDPECHGAGAMITRRAVLALLASGASMTLRQGVSSRGVKPQSRGKPSGLPFGSRLTDVGREAGLTHPIVYGGVDTKRYIVEVVGCGVALLDYDNDGWLDLFVLSGTRLEDVPAGTTNRLYREQSRRHVHRCHREGGAHAHRVGVGWSPWAITTTTAMTTCSSPTTDGTCSTGTTGTARSPT